MFTCLLLTSGKCDYPVLYVPDVLTDIHMILDIHLPFLKDQSIHLRRSLVGCDTFYYQ